MFQSCAPAPDNTKSREAQAPAKLRVEDYGEKKAHRGRIDWLPGKRSALPQKSRFEVLFLFPTCNFFLEYDSRFSVALFQNEPDRSQVHLHFPNKTV